MTDIIQIAQLQVDRTVPLTWYWDVLGCLRGQFKYRLLPSQTSKSSVAPCRWSELGYQCACKWASNWQFRPSAADTVDITWTWIWQCVKLSIILKTFSWHCQSQSDEISCYHARLKKNTSVGNDKWMVPEVHFKRLWCNICNATVAISTRNLSSLMPLLSFNPQLCPRLSPHKNTLY